MEPVMPCHSDHSPAEEVTRLQKTSNSAPSIQSAWVTVNWPPVLEPRRCHYQYVGIDLETVDFQLQTAVKIDSQKRKSAFTHRATQGASVL